MNQFTPEQQAQMKTKLDYLVLLDENRDLYICSIFDDHMEDHCPTVDGFNKVIEELKIMELPFTYEDIQMVYDYCFIEKAFRIPINVFNTMTELTSKNH